MIIREGLATLDIVERSGVFHPTLVWDDDDVLLIDTGLPGGLPALTAAAGAIGIELDRIDKIIITHQDLDHIGSLPDVVRACTKPPEVIAHALTKPYVEGDKRLTKMTPEPIAAALAAAPEDQRASVRAMLESMPRGRVDTTVVDGQLLPYCGKITVIFTPGRFDIESVVCFHGGVVSDGVNARIDALAAVRPSSR